MHEKCLNGCGSDVKAVKLRRMGNKTQLVTLETRSSTTDPLPPPKNAMRREQTGLS